jgi:predicted NAD-dependent protein-ADP-ribosyltransferase YbiA (DUF1768 family)
MAALWRNGRDAGSVRVTFKDQVLALAPETDEERAALAAWRVGKAGHVFQFAEGDGRGGAFLDLGRREDACREPINVTSKSPRPISLISNFAATPFQLDGRDYASTEGFWQSLRFDDEAERARVAALSGGAAKAAGNDAPWPDLIVYGDELVRFGTFEHWRLMERACHAKFAQNPSARAALIGTGQRPLTHIMRRDSQSIPGVVMAKIWMDIRAQLAG